ncbi:MAG: outer membrane beta-barrel protein [Candidatus Eisenbacteria bacterium]|nr:outer membrane beta-barrel protein [Candidatus Eisenbacteria bacterium]
MGKKTLLILGLITLVVTQVNAQSISLGPQVGYYKVQDADEGKFMGGAACRLKLTPVIGVEASINYRQETYADELLTVRSWPVMVTGLIYPLPIVYGAIGAGWYNTTFDYDQDRLPLFDDETTQAFGWHFGGGVEVPVGPSFKLTADVRYVFLNYDFKEIPGSEDLDSNFTVVTVGFLFGL